MKVTLYAVPAPGQKRENNELFLGTVRTNMHKAPYTALCAGLKNRLMRRGVSINLSVCDMQTHSRAETEYGNIDFGDISLIKFRVGARFEEVRSSIEEDDIIGISANFTHSRRIVSDFIQYARGCNRNVTIVVGGTDATHASEFFLRHGADIVVKGEGEQAFEDIILGFPRKRWDLVPNIVYQKDGSIFHTHANFLKQPYNFENAEVPDFSVVNLSEYTDTGEGLPPIDVKPPFISVETSRGCAQACSFCATPRTKGRFRYMKRETIRTHFETFKSLGIETLLFQEDNILSRIHRKANGEFAYEDGRIETLEMFKIARELGFSWEFTNGLEFNQFMHKGSIDHELIDALFYRDDASGVPRGCYRATIPLECLTEDSEKKFRKLRPISEAINVIERICKSGIDMLLFNVIIGRPEDTPEIIRFSYERCNEIRSICHQYGVKVYFNIYNLSLFPGTLDYIRLKEYLAFDIDVDPEVITFYLACLNTEHFSPLEATQARGTMASMLNCESQISDIDENSYLTSQKWYNHLNGN